MAYYKNLEGTDVVQNVGLVTSGIFQDGASSITQFHTSSTQYTNTGDYSVDSYRYNPGTNASASVQFGVAFGHSDGSGSLGTKGSTGDRPAAAVYGQFNNLINPPETKNFKFQANTTAKQIYAVVFNRARMRESIEPGGWELHLHSSGSTNPALVKLIDDSSTNQGGNTDQRNFAPEYNIVSGTLSGGTSIKTAASAETSGNGGSYGTFYPKLGVILLNPERLQAAPLLMSTVSASNTDQRNDLLLVSTIKSGSYFLTKRQEEITSRHYFVRATANNFNSTTNETFYTESVSGVKQVISGLRTDPKVYITTVGLYNDDNELLAIAKLSKPILKSKSREALIKVKLDF